MTLEYYHVESTIKPSLLEMTGDSVYIRKDLQSFTVPDEMDENLQYTVWSYQEAELNSEDFNEYTKYITAKTALTGANDSDNISKIISEQESNDVSLLTIMEAIADLYEIVSKLSS